MNVSQNRGPSRQDRESVLLNKWKDIEALDDEDADIPEEEFTRCKEAWFAQAFAFLIDLPQEEHCWCQHNGVTWPLLELFYYYFTDSDNNSSVKTLWKRFSLELGRCTQCVLQYYKAKEIYATEYLEEVVGKLLSVLTILDEERVASHLNEIQCKMRSNKLDSEKDSDELICVLFEVMRFPTLLDDAEIDTAFSPFLRYVENTYDLTLSSDQSYPGVYALLFHTDQATRGVALRLAGVFGKLRTAKDLEPIQPLLQKHLHCLEFDTFDQKKLPNGSLKNIFFDQKKLTSGINDNANSTQSTFTDGKNRPRAVFTRQSLWMGLKTLLGMLEPPAFEEGIIERYPSLMNIVLNHASEATPVFWNALHCLKLFLEVLGYKIWIKTSLSPGVMRSTLIGQCFHTRVEKIHLAIFDLFQPFLQSLEALQDGEYERQRRNIIYFLLQQVNHSRNFSSLSASKARQIAFLVVMRGFKMDPPCPPLECVHVWGPPLLESVKDNQLHISLRQPAVSLLETIIVADSVLLAFLHSKGFENNNSNCHSLEMDDDDLDDLKSTIDNRLDEQGHLKEFKGLDKLEEEGESWLCAPILWVDVLTNVLPSELPDSFSQAVVWAASRFCLVNPSREPPLELTSPGILKSSFVWEVPKGCDDGADGKLCRNTLNSSIHALQLVSLLKWCLYTFLGRVKGCNILERWSWDPYFAETLVLLTLDSSEDIRDFGRQLLAHFAKDTSLDVGLTFISSSKASASCANYGIFYASKLIIRNTFNGVTHPLQNLLFIAWKLALLWQRGTEKVQLISGTPNGKANIAKEGGFLKEIMYSQINEVEEKRVSQDSFERGKLQKQLSSYFWPLLLKLIKDGRPYSEESAYLMTFARMFDLLPLIFQNAFPSLAKLSSAGYGDSQDSSSAAWIFHFTSWGEVQTAIIHRRWKAALVSILDHLTARHYSVDSNLLKEVQIWLDSGVHLNDSIRGKVENLLRLLLSEASKDIKSSDFDNESSLEVIDTNDWEDKIHSKENGFSLESSNVQDLIVLSDDDDDDDSVAEEMINDGDSVPFIDRNSVGKKVEDSKKWKISDDSNYNMGDSAVNNSSEVSVENESENNHSELEEPCVSLSQRHMHPVCMQKQLGIFGKNATLDKYFSASRDKVELIKTSKSTDIPANINKLNSSSDKVDSNMNNLSSSKDKVESMPTTESADITTCINKLSSSKDDANTMSTSKSGNVTTNTSKLSAFRNKVENAKSDVTTNISKSSCLRGEVTCGTRRKMVVSSSNAMKLADLTCAAKNVVPNNLNIVKKTTKTKHDKHSTNGETDAASTLKNNDQKENLNAVLKELVADESDDAFKAKVIPQKAAPRKGLGITPAAPKRQLIQLQVPNEHLRNNKKNSLATRPPPRLDDWYRRILSLDYFAVVGLSSDASVEDLQAEPMLKVPPAFNSAEHYMDVFRPLVLEEFKAQLQQTYDQNSVTDGMTTGVLRLMSLEKVDDFEVGRFTPEAGADGPARVCFENDLLLLSRQPFQDGSQNVHMIAKVERQEKDSNSRSVKLVLKFYLRSGCKRLVKARSLLLERSKWHATRLMSVTPQLREFQALTALEHLPLLPIILSGRSSLSDSLNTDRSLQGLSDNLQMQLRADYNASQLQAIEEALQSTASANGHELSLVQGPPGTGKTRTIVAIISALVASFKGSKGQITTVKESAPFGTTRGNTKKAVSKNVAIARSWQDAALAKQQIQQDAAQEVLKTRDGRVRILVCAQSNAACDELVTRICKNGLYDSNGGYYKPFLVRVGNAKTVHPNSLPVFIDTLVENSMESDKENTNSMGSVVDSGGAQALRSKLHKIVDSIQILEGQLSKLQSSEENVRKTYAHDTNATPQSETSIREKVNALYRQRRQIYAELAAVEASERKSFEETRSKRQSLKRDIIRQAEVVVATLSACGGDVYSACIDKGGSRRQLKNSEDGLFDAVVIDEAAQALEPATLIPLQLLKSSHAKCIMVGDPKQLPATVISQMASRYSYECSMFERLQRGGQPVSMLNTQYRMHPEISKFPSDHFYDKQLLNGPSLEDNRQAVFHDNKYTGPYVVFDVVDGCERVKRGSVSQSLCNQAEVDVAVELFRNVMARYPGEVTPGRVGIITPYQQQLSLLREQFSRSFGQNVAEGIEFNTVDGFQGREVDILIFSTVRAASRNSQNNSRIGFVADVRRMNVALTRARFSLWVICNASTLQASPPWAALLQDAKERGALHSIKGPYRSFFANNMYNQESKTNRTTRPTVVDVKMSELCNESLMIERSLKQSPTQKLDCSKNLDNISNCTSDVTMDDVWHTNHENRKGNGDKEKLPFGKSSSPESENDAHIDSAFGVTKVMQPALDRSKSSSGELCKQSAGSREGKSRQNYNRSPHVQEDNTANYQMHHMDKRGNTADAYRSNPRNLKHFQNKSDLSSIRPAKRPRQELCGDASISRQQPEKNFSSVQRPPDGKESNMVAEDFLNSEWERFEKILAHVKVLYPNPS